MVSREPNCMQQELIGLTPEQLKERAAFEWQGKPSWPQLADIFNIFYDHYTDEQLYEIIHAFTELWPHSKDHLDLTRLAACVVEDFHYEHVRGCKPTQTMIDFMAEARGRAILRDIPKADSEHQFSDNDLDPFSEE